MNLSKAAGLVILFYAAQHMLPDIFGQMRDTTSAVLDTVEAVAIISQEQVQEFDGFEFDVQ